MTAHSPEDLDRSRRLVARIAAEIAAEGGAISFARYMALVLYAPGLGYYACDRAPITTSGGARGDFVTAPELGDVFGQCVARQCAEVLAQLGGGTLIEHAAGSGALACAVLRALDTLGRLPERYLLFDVSPEARARQQQQLETLPEPLRKRAEIVSTPPTVPVSGVILANELLDALPVERFRAVEGGIAQICVTVGADTQTLRFTTRSGPDALRHALLQHTPTRRNWPEGYESEISLAIPGWLAGLRAALTRGAVLLFDYGFPESEFYLDSRREGTLMCHSLHRSHHDPLHEPGLSDITAHVDFTAVAHAADALGFRVAGYTSLASFLMATGAAEPPPAGLDARAQLTRAAELRKLLLPHEMGELFKVMALAVGYDEPLTGFRDQDRRGRL